MPLSEHEQRVLARLEQEFQPDASDRARDRRWRVDTFARRVAAVVAIPVGMLLMVVALMLDNAVGIGLALLAYGLVLSGCSVLIRSASPDRATFAAWPRSRSESMPRRYPS